MDQTYASYSPETDLFPEVPVTYAGFWERFAAAFLDGLILMVPTYLIQYMLGDETSFVINIIIGWLYAALQESGEAQATIGKKALGIQVTNLEGGRLSFGQATGRYFGKWVSTIILLIGYFMMLWSEKRQTLHDMMAGALVIKK